MPSRRSAIDALTSFRFFAALAVFLHHCPVLAQHRWLKDVYSHYLFHGYSGVSFFFILSGFILAYNYRDAFTSLRVPCVWNFYVARFARIYPLHVLTFLAFLYLSRDVIFQTPGVLRAAVYNLTLTQSFSLRNEIYFSFNAPSWSLSCELFFYLCLPWALCVLLRLGADRPVRAALMLGFLLGASFAYSAYFIDSPRLHWYCYIMPWYRVCDFLIGVLAALLFLRISDRPALKSLGTVPATLLEAASLLLLLGACHFAPPIPLAIRFTAYFTPFMVLPIFVFAFQRGLLSRLLSSRCLMFLGEASFSFYMLHGLVLRFPPMTPYVWILKHTGPIGLVIALGGGILLLSSVCYLLFERPMRTLVRRLLHYRESQPVTATASFGTEVPARAA